MWPFRRKPFPSLETLTHEGTWAMSQGTCGGKPIIVRINNEARRFSGHPELPWRLGVAVPLLEPDPHGFPGTPEGEVLGGVENARIRALEHEQRGILAVVVSTGGMREFVSYVRSKDDASAAVAAAERGAAGHEVQHYVAEDARWRVFRRFT